MRAFIGAVGRVLVVGGLLLLLFVAYQLWGTGVLQARAQNELEQQFEEIEPAKTPDDPTVSTTTTVPQPPTAPPEGDLVGQLEIPKIGVSEYVVEGVNVADLRKGPGHYPGTALPGQRGNAAIAGHRTTYGAPFGDLDQLVRGDTIVVTTAQGRFEYQLSEDPFVVSPDASEVLEPTPDPTQAGVDLATLTLTTCHPRYSATERLIVTASLVLPPGFVPFPAAEPDPDAAPVQIEGLDGESSSRSPTVLWGIIVALVGLAWWFVFHRYPRWYVWIVGAVPFLVVLWVFYTYLERLLPSNY